jgi:hypothetical protein
MVVVGVAPQYPQSSPLFCIVRRSVMRDHAPRALQVSCQCPVCPAKSRKVPQMPHEFPQCPATNHDVASTPSTITMLYEFILLRDDTWHQRSLVISAITVDPQHMF